jgi:hypothetical protein
MFGHAAHVSLTGRVQTRVAMMTRRMKTRRQIRSARVSALSQEERLQEMREAQEQGAHGDDRADAAASVGPPHAARCRTPRAPEEAPEPAGGTDSL